jgi:ElaB/YqjD/DUF883 family membrane-anchored ribosome-binding protein
VEDTPAAPTVIAADNKTADSIEREMEQTRESITQKVAALENQVLGTIQTATDTITDTVQTVKDTVTAGPTAVKDTVAAVKDSVKETFASVRESVTSFDLSDCVRENPGTAIGTSIVSGFLTGFLLLGRESRPMTSRGYRTPSPGVNPAPASFAANAFEGYSGSSSPGLFGGLMDMARGELQQIAKQALATALESLKQSVNQKIPQVMDSAVQTVADRVTGDAGATEPGSGKPVVRVQYTPTTGF